MVEYLFNLDAVFGSLSDSTRRDILQRVAQKQLSVGQIAEPYAMSLAAISKHLKVLERARLIIKRRSGNEYFVELAPQALASIDTYLSQYRKYWEERFEALDLVLEQENIKLNKEGNDNGKKH
ncbi:MAG: ArsR/SmtB family transcription factor [Candidatus Saccharimonadia bacterium]